MNTDRDEYGDDTGRDLLDVLRALQIAHCKDPSGLVKPIPADHLVHDTAVLEARLRLTLAEREPAPATAARRPVGWLPALALGILTLGVAFAPHLGVVPFLLFALLPAALVGKWTFEAYAGPELERECAVLDQRARCFRVVRQRLDRAAAAVADARVLVDPGSTSAQARADLDEALRRLRWASAAMRSLAGLVARTSGAARTFAFTWFAEPVESCATYQQESDLAAPKLVRAAVTEALAQLRGIASMNVEVPILDGSGGGPGSHRQGSRTVAAEVEAVVHEVTASQTTLHNELTRLERAFDTVHHSAATHAIRTRIRARPVRAAALIGMNANVSTLTRARRTPARAAFLHEAGVAADTTLGSVRRATLAMRTAS